MIVFNPFDNRGLPYRSTIIRQALEDAVSAECAEAHQHVIAVGDKLFRFAEGDCKADLVEEYSLTPECVTELRNRR